MWNPILGDDWSRPDDGETIDEMLESLEIERIESEQEAERNRRLWRFACDGVITKDGHYIGRR